MKRLTLLLLLALTFAHANEFCNPNSSVYQRASNEEKRKIDKICTYRLAYDDALAQAERDMLEQKNEELRFSKWIVYVDAKYMTSQEILSSASWAFKVGQSPVLVQEDILILGSWTRKPNAVSFQERADNEYFKYFEYKVERRDNTENRVYKPAPRVMQKVVNKIEKQALEKAKVSIYVKKAEFSEEQKEKLANIKELEDRALRFESIAAKLVQENSGNKEKLRKLKKDYKELLQERINARKAYKKQKQKLEKLEKKLKKLESAPKFSSTQSSDDYDVPVLKVEFDENYVPKDVVKKKKKKVVKKAKKKPNFKEYFFASSGEHEAYRYQARIKKGNVLKEEKFGKTEYIALQSIKIEGFFKSDEDELYGKVFGENLFVNKDDLKVN